MAISITIEGDPQKTARQLGALRRLIVPLTQREMRASAQRAVVELKKTTPRSDGDGSLGGGGHVADGWRLIQTQDRRGFSVQVVNADPRWSEPLGNTTLGEILEFGTAPHVIRPKESGGVLAFGTLDGMVFTKEVNHPGTPAFGMVAKANEGLVLRQPLVLAAVSRAVNAVLRRA